MSSISNVFSEEFRSVDPFIWRACAGASIQIPIVDSRVYYFPQGHAEQASTQPLLSPLVLSQPFVLCRVLAVRFLANPITDEVFASLRLLPLSHDSHVTKGVGVGGNLDGNDDDDDDDHSILSFAKILTPSDANNGGGFSVPRFCADSIFPPLDYAAEPPVQNILVRDVHGMVWEFRHIYRGTPRRHLLTTGWSKFVNHKKLVAGDSVVFMRNRKSGELFVGVRRAVRANADSGGRWNCPVGMLNVKAEEEGGSGGAAREAFSRNGRGRVSAASVAEAAELAAKGKAFDVVYYPRAGWADFVVKAECVEESMNVLWTSGMRVKMAMETEDSSRMTWFQGTVSSAMVQENGPWRGSPWRMLQVTWDEPEILQNVKRVSPWQVEYVLPSSTIYSTFPPTKKFKVPHNPGLLLDGEGELFFPATGISNSMVGQLNPSLINFNSFPVGMQGARQGQICVSGLSNLISEDNYRMCPKNFVGKMAPLLKTVSTELNIGSLQSENLSPDSQSSVHFFGTEQLGKQGCNNSTKVGISSFQLFGKIIHMKETIENGFDDVGCTEDESGKAYKEIEGVNNLPDVSMTYTKLLDGVDVQCQSASVVEAYTL